MTVPTSDWEGTRFRVAFVHGNGWIFSCHTEEELWEWIDFMRTPLVLNGTSKLKIGKTSFVLTEWDTEGSYVSQQ